MMAGYWVVLVDGLGNGSLTELIAGYRIALVAKKEKRAGSITVKRAGSMAVKRASQFQMVGCWLVLVAGLKDGCCGVSG